MDRFLVLDKTESNNHPGGLCAWWLDGANGYTTNLNLAGRYSKADAEAFCSASHLVAIGEVDAYLLAVMSVLRELTTGEPSVPNVAGREK